MKLSEIISHLELCPFVVADDSVEVTGVHCGDLLSHVMANVEEGQLWITIQGHVNVVAVAQLRDVACIVLAGDNAPDPQTISKARALGVNICGSSRSAAELCMALAGSI